jgi:glycosyltransferase involved in cell wall biosynthesis
MKILMLSPYDAVSHALWRRDLAEYLAERRPQLEVTQIALPPRYFSWRFRGNSLSLSRHAALGQDCDLVIATSMTDLAALRGLNPTVARVPVIVYCHENQFAYPDSHTEGQLERQLTSIYTLLSADRVFFNSAYNRDTFLDGADRLLRKMPDEVPAGVVEEIRKRSDVVPVALQQPDQQTGTARQGPVKIAWNHRWEADKGPALLAEIVQGLIASDCDFSMSLMGQQFRQVPTEIRECLAALESTGRLNHSGHIADREVYLRTLAEHDVVLSTARHEFQGLAVQEAMLRGCVPIVPDDLSYPEYVPAKYRYQSSVEAVELLRKCAVATERPAIDLSRYSWDAIGPVWLDRIREMTGT